MLLRVGRVVAGVVALVLAASAAFPVNALGPRLGAGGCPISAAGGWERGDRPGELVPADGAVSVTMCELPLPSSQGQAAVPVRRLTAGVGAMVSELNALPTRDVLEAELRRRESAKGRVLGDDLHLGEVCTLVGHGTSLSFVVQYGDVRRPAVVLVDRNCGTARYAGRTRFGDPSDAFLRRYRAQLEARPAPVSPGRPRHGVGRRHHRRDRRGAGLARALPGRVRRIDGHQDPHGGVAVPPGRLAGTLSNLRRAVRRI
ncbi:MULTISPECIES: hypothetical protein [unclassified Nonomuraea]|uniref:hypothetical protein n=1 Tax=unclassified Nonomuraea TaxID=2593643 RepID=UPI0033FC8255